MLLRTEAYCLFLLSLNLASGTCYFEKFRKLYSKWNASKLILTTDARLNQEADNNKQVRLTYADMNCFSSKYFTVTLFLSIST